MTRGSTPTIHCDGDDGFCVVWDVDYYVAAAGFVGETRITHAERAPGWRCTNTEDFCPEHA